MLVCGGTRFQPCARFRFSLPPVRFFPPARPAFIGHGQPRGLRAGISPGGELEMLTTPWEAVTYNSLNATVLAQGSCIPRSHA